MAEMRICRKCHKEQDLECFRISGKYRRWDCRKCQAEYARKRGSQKLTKEQSKAHNRQFKESHPDYARDWHLRTNYGITIETQREMLEAQDGKCLLCSEPLVVGRFHVDHNHETGKVRGLLDAKCNLLLGIAEDDPARLERAALYLRRHE